MESGNPAMPVEWPGLPLTDWRGDTSARRSSMKREDELDYLRPVTIRDVLASWIVGFAVMLTLGLILVV